MSWFAEIHSNDTQWPQVCACCGHTPETTRNAIMFVPLKSLKVPLCQICKDHLRMPRGRAVLMAILAAVWFLLSISLLGEGAAGAIIGLGGLYFLLWWMITHRRQNPTCTTKLKPPVVTGMAYQGERIFLFTSESYARQFAALNGSTKVWKQGDKKPGA